MLYCCGEYLVPDRVIKLDDFGGRIQQKLEIAYCKKHGGKVCELSYFDIKTLSFKYTRPKRKDVDNFIKKCENQYSLLDKLNRFKQGTKANQAFVYGENVQLKDRIRQYAVDFNGTKNLVKELFIYSS